MNNSIPQKRCTNCGDWKPKTIEFFPSGGRSPLGHQYLAPVCKICKRAIAKARREADPEAARARKRELYAQNPEKHRAHVMKYHQANRDACLEKMRKYYAENPGASAQRLRRNWDLNRERYTQRSNAWRRANPEKIKRYSAAAHHKRRAAILASPSNFTSDDVLKQLKNQKGKCYWCSKPLIEYQVDHIFPLSKGGTNEASNICCACPNCNHSKGAKEPFQFTGRLF